MFQQEDCCGMRVTEMGWANCEALQDLRALLHSVQHPDSGVVLQAQHHDLLHVGGANAKVPGMNRRPTLRALTISARTEIDTRSATPNLSVRSEFARTTQAHTSLEQSELWASNTRRSSLREPQMRLLHIKKLMFASLALLNLGCLVSRGL
jgi:hypothetical protein